MRGIMQKLSNILYINTDRYKCFEKKPLTVFKRNKNLNELTGNTNIVKRKREETK